MTCDSLEIADNHSIRKLNVVLFFFGYFAGFRSARTGLADCFLFAINI